MRDKVELALIVLALAAMFFWSVFSVGFVLGSANLPR